MLSQLLGFRLRDERGRSAGLFDCSVALLEEDYPPVTRLHFRGEDGETRSLPWEAVRSVERRARTVFVEDLGAGAPDTADSLKREVLLRTDILDALVIDLQNRRTTRANDLWLEEQEGGGLRLSAADTSTRAILRRLSRGRFGRVRKSALYDWKYVEFLRGDPQAVRSGAGYNLRISRLPPGEIARLTNPLPYLHVAELITLLPDPKAADTLEELSAERQLQVFEELDEEEAVKLLALMAPDIAADLVGRLQTATMRRYLERLPHARHEQVVELLRYPEDTVGGIMTNDVVFAPARLTVAEARTTLRERLKEPDFVSLIYVVEDEESRQLIGLFSLRNLITAEDGQTLKEIMDAYVSTLGPLEPADVASHRVIDSGLAAMPVVGDKGRLLGVVTVDAAVALAAPPSWSKQAPRIFS